MYDVFTPSKMPRWLPSARPLGRERGSPSFEFAPFLPRRSPAAAAGEPAASLV